MSVSLKFPWANGQDTQPRDFLKQAQTTVVLSSVRDLVVMSSFSIQTVVLPRVRSSSLLLSCKQASLMETMIRIL